MVDVEEKVRGNISLPSRLQSPDIIDTEVGYDEGNVVPIINTQTAWYDVQIRDTARLIERLETRNDQLLDEYESTENLIDSVDVETSDEIAHLNRLLSVESEKIEETRRKIDETEKLREEERQAHLRDVDLSNEKFEKTRIALTSSIKALNAKINTLEDYKHTKDALLEKLRIQNETTTRNEENMAQKSDSINRKFKIDRDKLKNEMYSRLLALAGTFQLEISDTIVLPIHRLMRENIFIKAELFQIVDETLRRKEDFSRMRTMEIVHRRSIKSYGEDERKNLITSRIQRCLLEALKKMHSSMKKRLAFLNNEPHEFSQENYDNLADSVKNELAMNETRARKLEVLLHQESIKLGRAKYLKNRIDLRAKLYEEILYDVKYAVACALKMTETGQDILEMSKTELISHLLDLFVKGESQIHQCLAAASNETVARPDYVYVKGDLGFEPEHIDLEELTIRKELTEESTSRKFVLDISEVPGVLLPTIATEQNNELDEAPTRSTTSIDESNETSHETTPTETKESSDYQEDISEARDSNIHENEESSSAESEEQEET